MFRTLSGFLVATALLAPMHRAQAFTILGSEATWMTTGLGYLTSSDTGGPMFIGDGYRWNVPVLTYAFDDSFLTYYGSNGVVAVESAIKVLNSIPAADSMSESLSEFPTHMIRHNSTAAALGLIDLKTYVLSYMLQRIGVGAPERWVYTLRQFFTDPANVQHFSVLNPNYDPATYHQTSLINGDQFTYQIIRFLPGDNYVTVNYPVDTAAPAFSTAAFYRGAFQTIFAQGGYLADNAPGVYFPGITREEYGSVKYLYRTKNYAVETVLPDVVGGTISGLSVGTAGSGAGNAGGSGGTADDVWTPTYQVAVGGGAGNSPWSIIATSFGTNGAATGTGTVTTVVSTNATAFVSTALRPGVGKLTFARIGWDSVLAAATKPYAVTWTDRYVTNGVIRTQKLSRAITRPDFLFSAGDDGTILHIPNIDIHSTVGGGFINNSAVNRIGTAGEQQGPGIINTGNELSLSKIGRYYINDTGVGSTQDDITTGLSVSYGSFDGSTNAIIVYPDSTSIHAIEALVLRGR
jgi:hypothetical protein